MEQKQLIYLGGGFVVLFAAWWFLIRDPNPTTLQAAPDVDVPIDQVNHLTLSFPSDTVALERQGSRWAIQRPVVGIADSNTISQFLQQVGRMTLDAPVTDNVDRHQYYGFDTTAARINMGWGEDESFDLTVSRQGPDYQSVYVQIGDDPRIYSTRQRITVQQNTDRWRDRNIISLTSTEIQSADVSRPEGNFLVERSETGWMVDGVEADSISVDNWLRRFTTFNADGFHDGIPKQVLTDATYQIRFVTTSGATEQLLLMQTEENLAIASSAKAPTFQIPSNRLINYFPDPIIFFPE